MKRHTTFLKSFILAAAVLTVASCVQEVDLTGKVIPETEELLVHFRASMPERGRVLTRAADDVDFAVNTIDLLVFTKPAGTEEFIFQYKIMGRHLNQPNNTAVDFDALLTPSTDPVKLLVVANCLPGFLDGLTTPGLTETSVREGLFTGTANFTTYALPMTGVAELPSLSNETDIVRVPLIRSHAKVTVAVDLNRGSPAFTLSRAAIYRISSTWQLFPNAGAVENESTAPVPIVPSVNAGAVSVNLAMTDVGVDQYFSGYATETLAPPASDDIDPAALAACIVVEGRFADDVDPTYYRIDFGKIDDHDNPLGQILRNYWYRFAIVGAEGSGWATPEDAAANPASGLQTSVTPWRGGGNTDYYFGDNQYVKLSADSVLLDAVVGHTATMTITTSTVPFLMNSIRQPGAGYFDTVGPWPQAFVTDKMYFSMTPIPADRPDEQKWEITVAARTAESIEDYLEMHVANGLLTIYIKIARNPPPIPPEEPPVNDPTKRKIRVYSLGMNTNGSMNFSTSSGVPAILRNKSYFGPEGTVPCAGFEFVGVGTTSGLNIATWLKDIDIITTTDDFTPDAVISQGLYEWMQVPGHVIFLTSDRANVVDELRTILDPGMRWVFPMSSISNENTATYYGYGAGYEGIVPALQTAENTPFFDGIFGSIYTCAIRDTTPYTASQAQYVNIAEATTDIVPLMVATGSAGVNNDIMLTGVDPDRRIVYIGESALFHVSQMSTTLAYDPANYLNVMWANTWAWAVNKVMTENYDVPGMTDVE